MRGAMHPPQKKNLTYLLTSLIVVVFCFVLAVLNDYFQITFLVFVIPLNIKMCFFLS